MAWEEMTMELVADTNIVVAAILRDGPTRNLVFHPDLKLYVPEHVFEELVRHEMEFLEKSGLDAFSYNESVKIVFSNIMVVPLNKYLNFEEQARSISPDPTDWPFFAVALWKGAALWSNDKRLKQQEEIKIYNTAELFANV